jgi:hypothetical protein
VRFKQLSDGHQFEAYAIPGGFTAVANTVMAGKWRRQAPGRGTGGIRIDY